MYRETDRYTGRETDGLKGRSVLWRLDCEVCSDWLVVVVRSRSEDDRQIDTLHLETSLSLSAPPPVARPVSPSSLPPRLQQDLSLFLPVMVRLLHGKDLAGSPSLR